MRIKYTQETYDKTTVNHFDRVKRFASDRRKRPTHNYIFFDTETFKYYETENPTEDDIPLIVPYAIGVCIAEGWDKPSTPKYHEFIGLDCVYHFISFLIDNIDKYRGFRLGGFNIDYDIQAIRPYLEEALDEYNATVLEHEQIVFHYCVTDEGKKFISGALFRKQFTDEFWRHIQFSDLWMHDRTKSLGEAMADVNNTIWDYDDTIKNEGISETLYKGVSCAIRSINQFLQLPEDKKLSVNRDAFKKGRLEHYTKINMFKKGSNLYYYTSIEDYINKKNAYKLDIPEERFYLIKDVVSLPVVALYHFLFKETNKRLLGLTERIRERDKSITIPGHGKYLFEEFLVEYMTESYRCGVSEKDYLDMAYCFSGAFTASNRLINYICPENFEAYFPEMSMFDENGKSILRCYDINSLYPYVMSIHLPYGMPETYKPKGSYLTWYEIIFNGEIEPGVLYRWKPFYNILDNSFFGDNFMTSLSKFKVGTKKYILKELYDLFIEMCDSNVEIVQVRYQRTTTKQREFIDPLYAKKRNDDGKSTQNEVKAVKLILNSLYGKFAEKFRKYQCFFTTDVFTTLSNIYPKLAKDSKEFKSKIVHVNEDTGAGFIKALSNNKNKNADGEETRESILAGIYVTQKARWILLSAIKKETDNGNVVLNCDTDSIKLLEFQTPEFKIHNKDLGAWKYEGSFTHFGHPNKHKKYFLIDALKTSKNPKDWVKVASAGFSTDLIYDIKDNESLEEVIIKLKTLFDPNNRVIIPNGKVIKRRNDLWQIVLEDRDLKFASFDGSIQEPTHILKDRKLIKYK